MSRVTIRDVAVHAQVSPTTVSHALSGRRPVSAEARARITAAIEELGFVPSQVARALRRQRTQTIAFITDDISRVAAAKIARGVGTTVRENGFVVAIFETSGEAAVGREIVRTSIDRGVDGAIIHFGEDRELDTQPLRDAGVPIVFAGSRTGEENDVDYVISDLVGGVRAAARHLLLSGSGRIGFISSPSAGADTQAARAAILEELVGAGRASVDLLSTHTSDSVDAGQAAMHDLLVQGRGGLQGVVCASDLIAVGAVAEAKAWRLPIPARIAITGYGNTEAALITSPGLTSVETFDERIGQQSAELLLDRIEGDPGEPREVLVPTQLIVRGSAPTATSR